MEASPDVGASASQRNFVRQQGFRDAAGPACDARYPALMWQPRLVAVLVAVGIALRWWPWWLGLGVLLWWNALVPRANPFDLAWNLLAARGGKRARLTPAPPPRRFSQGMAGTFMLAIALGTWQGWAVFTWVVIGFLLAALVGLVGFRLCLGSFIYYHLRGEGAYARRTAPWAPYEESRGPA